MAVRPVKYLVGDTFVKNSHKLPTSTNKCGGEGIQFFLNMTLSWAAVSDRVMCLQSTNFIFGFPFKGKNSFSSAGLLKLSSMVCDCKLM